MKYKNSYDITDVLKGRTFGDLSKYKEGGGLESSNYKLFCKDTSYEDENNPNKLSLIIVSMPEEYVVNNNLKFNSLIVENNEYNFYYIHNDKRKLLITYYCL